VWRLSAARPPDIKLWNTEYYDLRRYMGKIIEKFNEKIVVVKNN
jgi:hypothetical protein